LVRFSYLPQLQGQVTALFQNGVRRQGTPGAYADEEDKSWLSIDWSEVTSSLSIDGRSVNLVDTGINGSGESDRPTVILIHGLGGCWQSWLLNINYLAARYRVIAVDLPGFGHSELPAESISIEGYSDFLHSLCDRLDLSKVVLAGNSMGGLVALDFALAHPERTAGLSLVASAGLSTETKHARMVLTVGRVWATTSAWLLAHKEPTTRRPILRRAVMQFTVRYPERLSLPLTQEIVQGVDKPGFVPALSATSAYSIRERLGAIDCPVQIAWGQNDMQITVADATVFSELIGDNSELRIFEDTGHCPMIERADEFNAEFDSFITRRVVQH
jgi:pimeloyl-ACP methyl ester carboxylesterase